MISRLLDIIIIFIQLMLPFRLNKARSIFKYYFSHQQRKSHFFKIKDGQIIEPKKIIYPQQYPINLADKTSIIPRGRPTRFLTPKQEIPEAKMMSHDDAIIRQLYNDKWKSPPNAYRLNIGLIGPVNSGKSELLARLSHKISAVSPKVNTTNEILHSFKSFELQSDEGIKNVQLKYFDAPGLSQHKTGYLSKGWSVLGDIDFSLLIVDSSKKFDDLMKESINRLQKHREYQNFMKALVLNKIDLVQNKRKFHGMISQIQKYGKFDKIFYTSALTGYGVEQIEKYLISMAKPGQWEVPKQAKSSSSELQIAQQMLKQGLFQRTYNQVPYELIIECESIASKSNGVDHLTFRVVVKDQNLQRMLIGKKGNNINWVRQNFKVSYAKMYGRQAEIFVRVNIKKNPMLREFQEMQESYEKQLDNQNMQIARQLLQKKGKILR